MTEDHRDLRHALRTELRWLGFAPLYDGLWISPGVDTADALGALRRLGVCTATVFRARADDGPGLRMPQEAWDFAMLRRNYDRFIARYAALRARVRGGAVGASEALVARSGIMDTWRTFPNLDPGLPAELLPADWPRSTARKLFVDIYDTLGPIAEFRVKQIVGEFDSDLAGLVLYHDTSTILAAT